MNSQKKLLSGMKPGLVSPYYFNDQGWNTPNDPRYSDVFQYLANILCAVGETYFVKNKNGTWEEVGNAKHASARVYQEHGGNVTINGVQKVIDFDVIRSFMTRGIVHFNATIYAPLQPDFLWFNGQRRLNIYVDRRLEGHPISVPACEEFLKIIRNSLCAAPDELGLESMLAEIGSSEPTPFRWVIHWLAARYQAPGYTTQTNLWFCGRRGTGKGSLLSVLRMVFGAKAVGKIEQSEIARGWSGSLFGADIIEWDEFKSTGWHDLNRFIKEKTGNETYAMTKRNVGDIAQPMVAAHIMSTNDARPMFVEGDDRQNCFIQTTGDPEWKARAKALWNPEDNALVDNAIPYGFAALLNSVKVDFAFIREPLATELRDDLVGFFADDSIEQWIDEVTESDVGFEYPTWQNLHSAYFDFARRHTSGKPKDLKEFKKAMLENKLAKDDVAKIKVATGRKSVRYVRVFALTPLAEVA